MIYAKNSASPFPNSSSSKLNPKQSGLKGGSIFFDNKSLYKFLSPHYYIHGCFNIESTLSILFFGFLANKLFNKSLIEGDKFYGNVNFELRIL